MIQTERKERKSAREREEREREGMCVSGDERKQAPVGKKEESQRERERDKGKLTLEERKKEKKENQRMEGVHGRERREEIRGRLSPMM